MNTNQNPDNTCGSSVSESSQNIGSSERAKEWLRMLIADEMSKDETDVDLIAHAEEGIDVIDRITAHRRRCGGHGDLKPVDIRQAEAGWSGRRTDTKDADRARMADAKRNLREPPLGAGAEVMELAQKDPEAAKEWLRMAIKMELCRTEQDPDFIAHLEEGIEIIDAMVAMFNDPKGPEGFTLPDLDDYNKP